MKKIAQSRQPLELDEVISWQKLIVDEQKEYGMACVPAGRGVLRSPKNDFEVSEGNSGCVPAEKVKGTMAMWVAMLNKAAMKIAGGMNVNEAAMAVGYVSSSQFSREFKRLYGQSPGQWRHAGQIPADMN